MNCRIKIIKFVGDHIPDNLSINTILFMSYATVSSSPRWYHFYVQRTIRRSQIMKTKVAFIAQVVVALFGIWFKDLQARRGLAAGLGLFTLLYALSLLTE